MRLFQTHIIELAHSIDDCYEKRRLLPCLSLIYTGIEVMASLEANERSTTQQRFVRWADDYLLRSGLLSCNGLELYSARCAVVHTFTPSSKLSKNGQAREIWYAWGNADSGALQSAAQTLGYRKCVCIHIDDLIESLHSGIKKYIGEIELDPSRQQRIEKTASTWFTNLDPIVLGKFAALHPHCER